MNAAHNVAAAGLALPHESSLTHFAHLVPPAAARQSFKEQEALVYQQLAQLIRDGVWLKSYLAAVMRLEHEAFQVGLWLLLLPLSLASAWP